jgi:hypothetical protein
VHVSRVFDTTFTGGHGLPSMVASKGSPSTGVAKPCPLMVTVDPPSGAASVGWTRVAEKPERCKKPKSNQKRCKKA